MTELGRTCDPVALVPGDPAAVRANAQALRERAGRAEGASDGLADIDTGAWTGAAAEAFREKFSYDHPGATAAMAGGIALTAISAGGEGMGLALDAAGEDAVSPMWGSEPARSAPNKTDRMKSASPRRTSTRRAAS